MGICFKLTIRISKFQCMLYNDLFLKRIIIIKEFEKIKATKVFCILAHNATINS